MANLSNINGKFVVEQTTGYVGVGTTDPNYPIEVLNASAEIALNASGGSIYRLRSDSTDSFRINKNGVGDRLVIDGSGNSTFSGTVQATQFTATNGLNYLKRDTDASLQLRSENTRSGLFITKPATNTIMGSALVLADESYRFGTANYYHQVMLQDGNTYFNQNVGIGNTGPYTKLLVGSRGTASIIVPPGKDGLAFDFYNEGNPYRRHGVIISQAADDSESILDFETKIYGGTNSTKMTIRGGGDVGIGTIDPQAKLHVEGNIELQPSWEIGSNNGTYWQRIRTVDGSATTDNAFNFETRNGSGSFINHMTILNSGRVGIGTDSPQSKLEVATSTNVNNYSDGAVQVVSNSPIAFVGASNLNPSLNRWGFKLREVADGDFNIHDYRQSATRMRIDSSGNVEIPTEGVDRGAISMQNSHFVNKRFLFDNLVSNAPTAYMILCEYSPYSDVNGIITMDRTSGLRHACSIQVLVSSGSGTAPVGGLKAMGVAGVGTPFYQLVTCDYDDGTGSSSHIAVQMSNPDGYYETSGAYFTGRIVNSNNGVIVPVLPAAVSNVVVFEANCRHNFQGDVSFGQGNIDILTDQNTNILKVRSTSGSFTSSILLVDCDRTSTNNTYNLANFTNAGTAKCVITDGGDLKNTNNSYGALSDERLKENIIDATPKLDDLMKVKIKTFNLKGDEQKQIGVVAQELEEVFPGMVSSAKTPDSEDETLYKSVKYSVFVPMLIKAIQELKADNDSLKAKIETLENN